ncbi:hypothetical protein [Paraburkholderia sediminicola]|uniref:hypothetical protein n=1 Tax=Paraburkholderia sediminicola TaxID=458836 RepID=UPI0038B87196
MTGVPLDIFQNCTVASIDAYLLTGSSLANGKAVRLVSSKPDGSPNSTIRASGLKCAAGLRDIASRTLRLADGVRIEKEHSKKSEMHNTFESRRDLLIQAITY